MSVSLFTCNDTPSKKILHMTIRIENSNGITFTGTGSDPDIVVASAKAYLNAINRSIQMTKEGSESPGSGPGR